MKIKKSYIVGAVIVALLAVFIIMGVTNPGNHAGHDHGDTQSDHNHTTAATQPDGPSGKDLSPVKAYVLNKHDNGIYTATVKGRNGNAFYTSEKLGKKPTFIEANQDVLEISDRSSKNTAAHWAVYCDIQNNRVSQKYHFVLANLDSHVAYVDYRSGQFHVFVRDLFNESTYFKVYELTDAVITESGSPEISYKLNGTTLSVTYSTKKGTDTIDIKMFEK